MKKFKSFFPHFFVDRNMLAVRKLWRRLVRGKKRNKYYLSTHHSWPTIKFLSKKSIWHMHIYTSSEKFSIGTNFLFANKNIFVGRNSFCARNEHAQKVVDFCQRDDDHG